MMNLFLVCKKFSSELRAKQALEGAHLSLEWAFSRQTGRKIVRIGHIRGRVPV